MLKSFNNKIKKFVLDSKMSTKMIAFNILIVILPMLLINIILDKRMEQIITDETSASYGQVVNQYVSTINYKIDMYHTLLENIASNRTIEQLLSFSNDIPTYEAYDAGYKISNEMDLLLGSRNIKELSNIVIYSMNEEIPIYGPKISTVKQARGEQWFEKMQGGGYREEYFSYLSTGTKKHIISFIKPIVNVEGKKYGQKSGFIKLDIDLKSFFDSKDSYQNKQNAEILIIDDTGNVIFGTNPARAADMNAADLRSVMGAATGRISTRVSGENMMLAHKNISSYGWKALFLFHYGEIDRKAKGVRMTIISFAIISTLVLCGLTTLFSKQSSKRIDILINKMEKVENGDLDITEKIQGLDEIGIVDNHFNKMVSRLQSLIRNNYIQQLERREAELNALQFQINPHFLYNTLESINSIASVAKCFEICEISHKLGEMFRYSINISRSEFVTLGKELNHIENYIYIQKVRFSDKFEVFYNIEEEARDCKILKFILQPIVENAIIHGFENRTGTGCIEIGAYVKDGCLFIQVEDDGNGMTEEQVEELNSRINKKEDIVLKKYKKSIGIRNVNMRIKLACGEDYGITVKSQSNAGTQVILKLPAYGVEEEDLHV